MKTRLLFTEHGHVIRTRRLGDMPWVVLATAAVVLIFAGAGTLDEHDANVAVALEVHRAAAYEAGRARGEQDTAAALAGSLCEHGRVLLTGAAPQPGARQ